MQSGRVYNVLFLCTGNSARSIMAEALIKRWGAGQFVGYSAGSHPTGKVNSSALELLRRMNFSTEGYRSKDWTVSAPLAHPTWTSCSPSAIKRPARSAQCGRVSR
jgi:Low molecular weight phosphotyrosine protein phosphatase